MPTPKQQGNKRLFKHDGIFYPPPNTATSSASPWETVVRSDLGHIQEQTAMPVAAVNSVKTYVSGSPWDTVVSDTQHIQQNQNSNSYRGNSVKTYVKPAASDNIAELKNYMEYQKLAPPVSKKNTRTGTGAVKNQEIPSSDPNESKFPLFIHSLQ